MYQIGKKIGYENVQLGANVNLFGITTDSEDGAIQYITTDSEDGAQQLILIDTEDR